MRIESGRLVRIEYELKVKDGEVIESSSQGGALEYRAGDGRLLPALESRLDGMEVGEERRGVIASDEAFGKEDSFPTKEIPRAEFPDGELEAGRLFEARTPQGGSIGMKILEVTKQTVKVRLLPALIGRDLEYRVKVLMIDDPTSHRRESVAPPPMPADAIGDDLETET